MAIDTNLTSQNQFSRASAPASTITDDLQNKVAPAIGRGLESVGDGLSSFTKENPGLAKWGAFGLALIATPFLFKTVGNLWKNPKEFAIDTVLLTGKLALGLTFASMAVDYFSNRDKGLSLGDAFDRAVSGTIDLVGNVAEKAIDMGGSALNSLSGGPGLK